MELEIIVDGGCLANGTADAEMYGSAKIGSEIIRWTFGAGGSNNQAEYLALIHALDEVSRRGNPAEIDLIIRGDSQLVRQQVIRAWKAKDPILRKLRDQVRAKLARFHGYTYSHLGEGTVKMILGH